MTIGAIPAGRPIVVTGTGSAQAVLPRDGVLLGFIYNSGGVTPTASLYDSATTAAAASANQFLTSMAMAAGPGYYPMNVALNAGLVATLTSGAIVTFIVA